MVTLEREGLVFRFPTVHKAAEVRIAFQRTLRIPDDGRDWSLPPGLGSLPLRHLDDFAAKVPADWQRRGGVLLPMWQAEAMWLSFRGSYDKDREVSYPFALKIAAGKRSAVTGEAWTPGLGTDPQDYVVVPRQPWLDGFCVKKGRVKQFVAMPLGAGYTVEEQLTGAAEFGGLQIEAIPMKRAVFERRFPVVVHPPLPPPSARSMAAPCYSAAAAPSSAAMGMGAGGSMRQEIYRDPYDPADWDVDAGSRCFVHLVNSEHWQALTGEQPPTRTPTAAEYSRAGLPWFQWYGEGKAVKGEKLLKKIKSVLEIGQEKHEQPLPENESVMPAVVVGVQARKGNEVRVGEF